MIDNSLYKPQKVNLAITNSNNITQGTRAKSIDDYLLNTNDEFSDNGTECCPPR